jgi:hypothetical protein
MPSTAQESFEIPYVAPLLGNIRQILTGLQGFDSMAREIIQNADDAGAKKIRFSIEKGGLRVWNDELFLSCGSRDPKCPWEVDTLSEGFRKACDFHAISTVGSGNKYRDPSLIGRFGIGFVSVYQITDTPIVRSLGVQLDLDPLLGRNKVTPIADVQGSEFELPWAFDANSPTREALNASAIEPEDLDSVQADLVAVAEDCLLFLRNLKSIEIARDGVVAKHVECKSLDDHRVRLSHLPEDRQEDWYVIHASAAEAAAPLREKYPAIERLGRQTEIQIAFYLGEREGQAGRLFAYLPTEQNSPVPCHINADFFPEQNRKALVLSGEQHERYWNEMLLAVAANEISRHLLQLRDVLGPSRLWKLIGDALTQSSSPHFGVFWTAIAEAAREAEIAWSSGESWIEPKKCRFAPNEVQADEERALTHIGVDLAHSSLRPFLNALQALGARRLTLGAIVDALEIWDEVQFDDDISKGKDALEGIIRPLWKITNGLTPSDPAPNDIPLDQIERLKSIRFVPKPDGTLVPIDDLYRLPSPVTNSKIEKHIPGLPLVAEFFEKFENLHGNIDLLTFSRFLAEIAAGVKDEPAAKKFFGNDIKRIRQFYRLLSDYPRAEENPNVSSIMAVPLLAGHDRFLTPAEAVLPGGFKDPVGRFDVLDITYYDDRTQEFLKEVFNVRTLTLEAYIRDHLADILTDGLSDDEYVALYDQLTSRGDLLDDDDNRGVLSDLPLVKTMDGAMRRPSECYFRSSELSEILGDQKSLWVDTSVFASFKGDVAKAFLKRLGMRNRPSLEHALDRIDVIVQHRPTEVGQKAIGTLLQFVFRLFEDDDLSDKEVEYSDEVERLRNTDWLPASIEGNLQTDVWYAPHELYQPFRSAGFDSQVPVLGIRQNPRKPLNRRFLEFLEMPAEPETSVVVDHLFRCAEEEIEASVQVYQILNERFGAEDDIVSIERLKNGQCIYSSNLKRYLGANRVFWSRPRLRNFCFQAPEWMHQFKELFDFLGVQEEPDGSTYSTVLQDIAKDFGGQAGTVPADIQLVHGTCLRALANEIRDRPTAAQDLLDELELHPFLITIAGTLAFAEEVAVKDSDWLAEAFGDELDGRLVQQSPEYSVVFERLRLETLSAVTHLEAVRLGEEIPDEEASEIIAERRDLLLWLFSGLRAEDRERIYEALDAIEVARSESIQVRSVFALSEPAIVSIPKSEEVLYERNANKLYVHLDLGDQFWIPAFRAIFSTLVAGDERVDVRQCALNASHVLLAPSLELAQQELEQAGFTPPSLNEPDDTEFEEDDLGDIDTENGQPGFDGETEPTSEPDASEGDDGHEEQDASREQDDTDPENGHEEQDASPEQDDGNPATGDAGGTDTSDQDDIGGKGTRQPPSGGSGSGDGSRDRFGDRDSGTPNSGSENKRTQWMRSYVVPQTGEDKDHSSQPEGQQERNTAIDEAAMKTSMEYEVVRDCNVERMPHFNPGFDIISHSKSSTEKRMIEVKGLDGEWTGRGVKLTRTQIMNAEEYGDEYWLYVVEHALDAKNRKIHAIQNPFFKAAEFWFDYVWKDLADEQGGDLRSQFAPGRKIRVENWGPGTIIDVQHRGIASNITIEFLTHGKKNLPFNMSRMELIED